MERTLQNMSIWQSRFFSEIVSEVLIKSIWIKTKKTNAVANILINTIFHLSVLLVTVTCVVSLFSLQVTHSVFYKKCNK